MADKGHIYIFLEEKHESVRAIEDTKGWRFPVVVRSKGNKYHQVLQYLLNLLEKRSVVHVLINSNLVIMLGLW